MPSILSNTTKMIVRILYKQLDFLTTKMPMSLFVYPHSRKMMGSIQHMARYGQPRNL